MLQRQQGNRRLEPWEDISKRLRHFNICEVAVRDNISTGEITLTHLPGHCNIADLFTKEIRDVAHFQELAFRLISARDLGGCQPFIPLTTESCMTSDSDLESWMTGESIPTSQSDLLEKDTVNPSRPSSPTTVMI